MVRLVKTGRNDNINRGFRKNKKGALEGFPLYMVILVIITGLVIGIVAAWFTVFQPNLKSIVVDPQTTKAGVSTQITVTATDTSGNKLKGATVRIEGSGINAQAGVTGDGGTWTSPAVTPILDQNENFGTITVTVTYTGTTKYIKTTEITVTKN